MAVAYQVAGHSQAAAYFLSEISRSLRPGIDKIGQGVPAASRDRHATGFDWEYNNQLHVGATSWYVLAANQFNPYWQVGTVVRPITITLASERKAKIAWSGDVGWSFVLLEADFLGGPWREAGRFAGTRGRMSYEEYVPGSRFYMLQLLHP